MANIWEKAILILAGNLNSGRCYLITTVMLTVIFPDEDVLYMSTPPNLGSDLSKKSAFFQLFRPKVQFNLAEILNSWSDLRIQRCIKISWLVEPSYSSKVNKSQDLFFNLVLSSKKVNKYGSCHLFVCKQTGLLILFC